MSNSNPIAATIYRPGLAPIQLDRLPSESLRVGDGFYDGDRRYRIVDVWHSVDGSEPFNWGMHVWLEDVSGTSADRLLAEEPGYFQQEASEATETQAGRPRIAPRSAEDGPNPLTVKF